MSQELENKNKWPNDTLLDLLLLLSASTLQAFYLWYFLLSDVLDETLAKALAVS